MSHYASWSNFKTVARFPFALFVKKRYVALAFVFKYIYMTALVERCVFVCKENTKAFDKCLQDDNQTCATEL